MSALAYLLYFVELFSSCLHYMTLHPADSSFVRSVVATMYMKTVFSTSIVLTELCCQKVQNIPVCFFHFVDISTMPPLHRLSSGFLLI
jgi:hypothetical protein